MSINKGKKNLPHNLWLQRLPFSYPSHYKSFQLLQSSAMICVIRSPAKKRSKKSSPINHDIDVIFKISDDHTDPKKQRQDLLKILLDNAIYKDDSEAAELWVKLIDQARQASNWTDQETMDVVTKSLTSLGFINIVERGLSWAQFKLKFETNFCKKDLIEG